MSHNNLQKNHFFIIFHDFQVCWPRQSMCGEGKNRRKCQNFRDKSVSNFFSIIPLLKPFKSSIGIIKIYFQLNFHGNSADNFYGAQTESFFFQGFLLCQIIKGSSNKLSRHPNHRWQTTAPRGL